MRGPFFYSKADQRMASADTVLLQECLLVARNPAEDFRFSIQNLHEIVDIEVDYRVRLALTDISRPLGDMRHAMALIDR